MYGGESPKRHRGYTNNPWAARVDLGVYSRTQQAKKQLKTVRHYLNSAGKKAYAGTAALKSTQSMP